MKEYEDYYDISKEKYENILKLNSGKENKLKELWHLALPIIHWLRKNYDPMCKIIIEDNSIEVLRSEMKNVKLYKKEIGEDKNDI